MGQNLFGSPIPVLCWSLKCSVKLFFRMNGTLHTSQINAMLFTQLTNEKGNFFILTNCFLLKIKQKTIFNSYYIQTIKRQLVQCRLLFESRCLFTFRNVKLARQKALSTARELSVIFTHVFKFKNNFVENVLSQPLLQ